MLRRSRSVTLSVALLALLAPLTAAVSASAEDVGSPPTVAQKSAPVDSDDDSTLDAPDTTAAAEGAASTDEPVEDLSQRTETVTVLANPDGTFTSKQFATPVRIKRDGNWVDVDHNLTKKADGSWAPKASPVDVSINGGSAKEAARVTFDDGESLAVTWPADLPEPTIDGGVATYKLSDATDLIVAVTGSGVTTRLRLNEAPTAEDPVFTFGLRTDSVDVTESAGGLKVVDDEGNKVGGTSTLVAWDATTDDAGEPAKVVPLVADLDQVSRSGDITTHDLELTTPQGYLSDPDTEYPVTIDPDISDLGHIRDTWVREGDTEVHGSEYRLIVGKINAAANTNAAQSFIQFDNDKIAGKNVISAQLGLWQYYAYSCTDRRMNAYPVGAAWTSGMTYPSRPAVLSVGDSTYVLANRGASGCADGWTTLNVTNMAQAWADGQYTNNGIRLTADDPNYSSYERRFCSFNADTTTSCGTAARTPHLSVTYNSFPSTASTPTVQPTAQGATVTSTVADPDGGNVRGKIAVYSGSTVVAEGFTPYVASGQPATLSIGELAPGTYTTRAWSDDGSLTSASASAARTFTIAPRSVPVSAPTISGADTAATVDATVNDRFPSGAGSAVVVNASTPKILAEAIALSSALDRPVVTYDTQDQGSTVSRLHQLAATSIVLYGAADAFGPGFETLLQSEGIAVASTIQNDSPIERTSAGATLVSNPTIAVLVADNASVLSTSMAAAAAASGTHRPLLVVASDEATDNSAIADYFATTPVTSALLIGSSDSIAQTATEAPDGTAPDLTQLDDADPVELSRELATFESLRGTSTRSIFVAPSDQPEAAVLAGYAARTRGQVLLGGAVASPTTSSAATAWAADMGPELHSITAIGSALPSGYATTVASDARPALQDPAFRVTSIAASTGGADITLSPVLAATAYKAYDIEGVLVANAATPNFTVPPDIGALKIDALRDGSTLRSVQVRMNGHTAENGPETLVAVSTDGNLHHLAWSGESGIPAVVTRYEIDPATAGNMEFTNGQEVSIACGGSFTDQTSDKTKQWVYDLTALSGPGGAGCEPSGSETPTDPGLVTRTAIVPPFAAATSSPATASRMSTAVAEEIAEAKDAGGALPSVTDAQVLSSGTSETSAQRTESATAATSWQLNPITIRYQGFIPGDKFAVSSKWISSGGFATFKVNGNGRSKFDPNGSYKFRADLDFFGYNDTDGLNFTRSVASDSKLYGCLFGNCVTLDSGVPSANGITLEYKHVEPTAGFAAVRIDSKIPILDTVAPAISAYLTVDLEPGSSHLYVKHDRMPRHEIWAGPFDVSWVQLHGTKRLHDFCLVGSTPGCTVKANVSF